MRTRPKQSGFTLPEMVVVIATIALLVGFGLPAIRALLNSFATQSGAKTLISTALASAHAIAAKEQRYAGVRFQQDLSGKQYMIFIVHDPQRTKYASGFKAVDGVKPIKLPDSVGVKEVVPSGHDTAFSIVFSPSGKLVIHDVRVRNRDGEKDGTGLDDIFNTEVKVQSRIAMFIQDAKDNEPGILRQEPSQSRFIIFSKTETNKSEVIYINPYMGTMISKD